MLLIARYQIICLCRIGTFQNGLGKHFQSFDVLYTMRWANPADIYEFMVAALFKEAELTGTAVYAVPGSADVLEDTTNLIRVKGRKDGAQVKVISGVSFLALALAEINFDFTLELQLVLALPRLQRGLFTKYLGMNVCQIEAAGGTRASRRLNDAISLKCI
jgi:uncharacterized protein YabN with tetrapyrrole methylase and pyrophosphatase domain